MVKSKVEIFFIMRSEQAIEEIKKLIKENRTIFLILMNINQIKSTIHYGFLLMH